MAICVKGPGGASEGIRGQSTAVMAALVAIGKEARASAGTPTGRFKGGRTRDECALGGVTEEA